MIYPPRHYHQWLFKCFRVQGVTCSVLSGKFNITKIVSVNFPLLVLTVTAIQGQFFSFIPSSSLFSHGNRAQLFLHGCKVNEAAASPCSAIYYRSLTQYSYFLNEKKKVIWHYLTYLGIWEECAERHLFIQKSAKRMASSCFEGPPAGKLNNPVIIRIKTLHTVWKKT